MAKNDSTQPAIPSGKAYVVAWIAAQVALNLPWLAPWLTNQIKAAQSVDATLAAPDASKAIHAGVALLVSTLICFVHKVWKELEADAVRGTANLIKAAPGMANELLGRCWDACWGFCTRWFVLWGFKRRYLKELCYRYGLFNDKGLGLINANRLDLDKVYVELQAAPDVNLNKPNFNPVTREISHRAPLWDHLRTLRPGFALAMIGAPGSGKTTLLHHALLTFARNRQWRRRMRFQLPIFIELRKIAAELNQDPKKDPTLPKLIESLWKKDSRFTELVKHLPKGWLERWLHSGRCLLLWDGLDEVADPDQRKRVRDWVETMVLGSAEYRSNISLVTARPAGYRDAPLEHAQAVEIQAFQWEDTKRFVQQWYHATEVVSSGNVNNAEVRRRATGESNELLTRLQDSPKLGDLAVNPLLLTMICMVHRFHGALPGSRSQLYDEICQVLLERWRQQRGMRDEHTSQQKLEVLRPLAVWMMEHRVKEIKEDDMLPCIEEPLARIGVAPGNEAALAFIHDLRDSSGLWLDKELKVWAFAHLTFQEHLCADAWVKKPALCPTGSWQPFLRDPWWREMLLLYAAKAEDATQLALDALEGDTSCRAFALQLMDEKINLAAVVRTSMEQTLLAALNSKDKDVFLPAAEAWFARQQERNYQRLDDRKQISGWVTAAEYQAFVFTAFGKPDLWRAPLHWSNDWFFGSYDAPIAGISGRQADEFCEWLNKTHSTWFHRLPSETEIQDVAVPAKDIAAWLKVDSGDHRLDFGGQEWRLSLREKITAVRNLDQQSPARALALARDLDNALDRALDRDIDRALALTRILSFDRYLERDIERAFDRVSDRDRHHSLDRALALALDRVLARDLARDLDRALSIALTLALDLDRNLDLGQTFDSAGKLVRDLAGRLNIDLAPNHLPTMLHQQLAQVERTGDSARRRSALLLRALLPINESSFLPGVARACSRAIVFAICELYREAGFKQSANLQSLESIIKAQADRAIGCANAFEGLRVVRIRRQ